jgi:hypothetical protein
LLPEHREGLVWHLDRAGRFLGNGSPKHIDLVAEELPQQPVPFDVLPEFASLQISRGPGLGF